MAETDKNAAAEIDYDKLAAAMAKANGTAIEQALAKALEPMAQTQKVLADTLAKLPPAGVDGGDGGANDKNKKADGAAAEPALPKTQAELDTLIESRAAKLIDDKLKARDTQHAQTAERAKYVGEKMKDLPEVYRAKLGADPKNWPAEEQAARDAFKADAAAAGFVAKDVGGNQAGAGGGGGGGQTGKLNPITSGLTQAEAGYASSLVLPTAATNPAATATAAAAAK